ncbi:LuxR C-terminal-related transcriptional regulator [Actinomadura nitritigenes]|uniref:LuxR C-terminal-related transcriptional regulator n=1 Tax=Actinomadura nitritigenes TaxID=134602 RepID=UPI0036B0BA26
MWRRWPLTGRDEELRYITGVLEAREGPAGVVVAGPPGVGKTRLAREALAAAERRGAAVRWAAASNAARTLPLGAFTALLGETGGDPAELVRRATDVLAGAGPGGAVVGVDDAHLLDDLSAFVVQQLVQRRAARGVLTLRAGEPAPDVVTALWKDGHLTRLELRPLPSTRTARLLEAVLGGPVDSRDAARLWTVTQGNALYLRHLVDGEVDAGRLREVDGVWRWRSGPALPPGLTDLIRARMGRLTAAQRDVLDALAFGEPLGVPLLARLTDPAAVEDAEARGLVEIRADGRRQQARLAHPLYGEVEQASCGRLRARRWRGRLARALAGTGARRADDTLRRAVLMLDSDLPHDADVLAAAAGTALEMLDFALAARLAAAAVRAGGGPAVRLVLGYALTWSGNGTEAEEELAALEALAGDDAERVRATLPRAGNLFWTLARPDDAQAVLAEAEAAVRDPAARDALTAMRSVFDAFLARPGRSAAAARAVMASGSSPEAVTLAGWGLAAACCGLGRLDGLGEAMARIEALAVSYSTGQVRIGGFDAWVRALRLAGRLHDAEDAARRFHEAARAVPGAGYLFAGGAYAEVMRDRGQVRSAVRLLREAVAGIEGADPGGWAFCLPLRLAPALAMTGDAPEARRALERARAVEHPSLVFMAPDVLLAEAWVAAAEGAVSEAAASARRAAVLAASQGQPALEVSALHTAARFGDAGVAGRLAELASEVDGPLAHAAAAHAGGLRDGDAAALEDASARLERLGAVLAAADAAAHAAACHARDGRRGPAAAAAARAHSLAEACQGARTPALAATALPPPLTPREREIVALAGAGLTNRQIAERLVLSVRTVEGHLYRASAKLGVTGRADLPALLRREP